MKQFKKKIINKLSKIVPALIQGKLLRKTWAFTLKLIEKFVASIDRLIGIFAKFILSITTPVDDKKIVFITFQGDYTCNPKYITDELIRRKRDYDLVWSARQYTLLHPDNMPREPVRAVEQMSYEFYKELASAKVWVVNSVDFLKNPLYKKKNQFLIETWHGSLGIKRFDKNVNSGRRWVQAAELCGKISDFCISNSDFENYVFRETYWPKTEILQFGHPRNDIFFSSNDIVRDQIKRKIYQLYDIPENAKLVLYAPTFRDSKDFICYNIRYQELVNSLSERFGGVWYVLVRFHPTVRKYAKSKFEYRNIIDATKYPDIQELMAISDVAITDYSSWIYDYILSKKPGFIFATDIETYNNERGFYFKLESTPFPVATNNEQLFNNIALFDEEKYQEKVETFLEEKGCVDDGLASARVADLIEKIIDGEIRIDRGGD